MSNTTKKSGVASHVYAPYNFEDHLWSTSSPQRVDLLELARRCIKVDGTYYLKQPNSGHWVPFKTMSDAIKEAYNKWLGGGLECGVIVSEDLIETFFNGAESQIEVIGKKTSVTITKVGSCPNIQHDMVVPFAPQYVIYNKDTYLNTWCNEMIESNSDNARLGKLVLELIYRSLCNGESLADDVNDESTMLLEQVIQNEYTNVDFRFVMNWLAALYQTPGINLQTNLWFCGEQNGVGKGTLVDIMGHILGKSYVGSLNQTEIEAGWNDHLVGKLLVESNEFDSSGRMNGKAWGKWIKTHCNEPTLDIRQRNTTARKVLNIGNYIFTTNEESPVYLDKTDRRNQLIKTTDNPYWKEFASRVQVDHVQKDPKAIAAGFAWVLEQVVVDMSLLKSAFVNTLKAQIISDSQNIVEKWICQDELLEHGVANEGKDLYEEFKQWMAQFAPSERLLSYDGWGKLMTKAGSLGVRKTRSNGKTLYTIGEAVAASAASREAVAADVSRITGYEARVDNFDVPVVIEKVKPDTLSAMERMRAKLRRMEANGEDGLN